MKASEPSDTTLFENRTALADAWKTVINRWSDEQGLVQFEKSLDEFTSSTEKRMYLSDLPWPSLKQEPLLTGIEVEAPRLFAYADTVRSKEHVTDLMHRTLAAYHPELWKKRKALHGISEESAIMWTSEAEAAGATVAKLLKGREAKR